MAAATNIESVCRWKIHVPRIGSQKVWEIFYVFSVFMIRIVAFLDNHFKKELYKQKDQM
jgi:hypothetical protein